MGEQDAVLWERCVTGDADALGFCLTGTRMLSSGTA